jgi:hypothetical protein
MRTGHFGSRRRVSANWHNNAIPELKVPELHGRAKR